MNSSTLHDRFDLVEVVWILVFMQGTILIASTLEAFLFLAAFGPAATPSALLTGAAAVLTLVTAAGVGRRARWARRWTLPAEAGVFLGGSIDLALALLLTGAPLGLVPVITRLVVPVAVIKLLRRPSVKAAFGGPVSAPTTRPVEPAVSF